MLSRLFLLAGLLAGAALATPDARAERRIALVIGNSGYAHAPALRNPRNDSADMAEALKNLGFEVVLGHDLDQQQFAMTIERYARMLENADVGLFYYAGHGLQINDKNYLVSTNARLENEFLISSETIELDAIIKLMESKSATNLVFLDACRNNPLTDNLRRNLAAMKRNAAVGRGLARVEASGRDTLVAFAAAPGQEAADGAERNSPFTAALIKHLPKPGLEVSVMLKEVAADVRRDTQNAQRPQQLSDMTRTFYFAKAQAVAATTRTDAGGATDSAAKPAAQAALPSAETRSLDVAFWNAAQSANECDAVRAYLQRFPEGIFVELAKLSERRLCGAGRRVTVVEAVPAGAQPSATPPLAGAPETPTRQTLAALPDATVATPAAPSTGKPVDAPRGAELARTIQLELMRVGCGGTLRADGQWKSSTKEAIRLFNKHARTKLGADEPSVALMAALREHDERVCPMQCQRGFQARGNACVAVQREPAKSKKKVVERTRAVERRPAPRRAQPEPPPPPQAAAPVGPPLGGIGIMFGRGRGGFRF
jgi:uncharacterized caspase-like protein